MTEDSFIREVNEEVRQERLSAFWRRYRFVIIGAAIGIVLLAAAVQGYSAWAGRGAARAGDALMEALELADKKDYDAALAKLDDVERKGPGVYPALAAMRNASILADRGEKADAVVVFDAVAEDASLPGILRRMASVRAAYILVDTGSLADVEKRVGGFATDIDPMRFAAREALGLAAWKAGRTGDAVHYLSRITEDSEAAGTGFFQRADMMLNLIRGRERQTES